MSKDLNVYVSLGTAHEFPKTLCAYLGDYYGQTNRGRDFISPLFTPISTLTDFVPFIRFIPLGTPFASQLGFYLGVIVNCCVHLSSPLCLHVMIHLCLQL